MHSKHSLFLLAHQDDEFGVFGEIERRLSLNDRVSVVYLTSGTLTGSPSDKRDLESLCVLQKLGVMAEDVHFLGRQFAVPDGRLVDYLEASLAQLVDLCARIGVPDDLYVLAWEGGHQDHDAAHLIGLACKRVWGSKISCRQFPLYSGQKLPSVLFRLFAPLKENGPVESYRLSWSQRVRFMVFCWMYPSQIKTWIGLFPFLMFHYVFWGTQQFQQVDFARVSAPPHQGYVLYHRRGFYSQHDFAAVAKPFIDAHIALS